MKHKGLIYVYLSVRVWNGGTRANIMNKPPEIKIIIMAKTYSEKINIAQVMQAGMQNNAAEASQRGWSNEKNTQLGNIRAEAIALNDEQERLKAELKMKTAALNAKMAALNALMNEAKKVVKLGFPKEQWKEFGVADKR